MFISLTGVLVAIQEIEGSGGSANYRSLFFCFVFFQNKVLKGIKAQK